MATDATTRDQSKRSRRALSAVIGLTDEGRDSNSFSVVSKFGGSSLADALAIARCAGIVREDGHTEVVVVSALADTTNRLETLANIAVKNAARAQSYWWRILEVHRRIARDLSVHQQVATSFLRLDHEASALVVGMNALKSLCPALMDQVYSLGERLSSTLVAAHLGARLIDARTVLKTNGDFGHAQPLVAATGLAVQQLLKPVIRAGELVVTQGFIGATLDGQTTTLGREGSDYSAALIAEAIGARGLNIWTDVPGIASCDPRLVDGVSFIGSLSYQQASLLARRGAKILFPTTLEPAQRSGICVFVGSSLDCKAGGTRIFDSQPGRARPIAVTSMQHGAREQVSLIGHRLDKLVDFDPLGALKEQRLAFEVRERDARILSVAVDSGDRLAALRLLHRYLISYNARRNRLEHATGWAPAGGRGGYQIGRGST